MSSTPNGHTKPVLLATTILLEGSLPSMSSTIGTAHCKRTDGLSWRKRVDPPLIQYRAFSSISCPDEEEGRKIDDMMAAYMDTVSREWAQRQAESADPSTVPHWEDPVARFQEYTQLALLHKTDQLSECMSDVYAAGGEWPFTYRVYSSVNDFLDAGGELFHPNHQPLDTSEYADRLERAVTSARGVDELESASSDTIKLTFTTDVSKPTRLERNRLRIAASEESGNEKLVESWRVLPPKVGIVSRITEDSPDWIKKSKSAHESFNQSIIEAIGDSFDPGSTVQLGPQTTSGEFVTRTGRLEHRLFKQAAYIAADQVSSTHSERHATDDSEEAEGHPVKAAWLEQSMFDVVNEKPAKERLFYSQRLSKYENSIEDGLLKLWDEGEGGGDGFESGTREWGDWA
ncbi:hypothetical protein I350_07121 [Cryptococcus amylolentus CBS 6273]|uniref:Uncharacterized protein n=1 Tax=Cryptococcus amylolentus CBS 6273 TaxID=1296118 RepID=A0A1E3JDS3_9TREE|nr:hypothetical protein I350_07121 [Cryptococcus amylolentus CBS 6273]